ncbi:MAG TPA: hypothetical protein DIT04_01985 [Dysgonomonas sp.]|nr:hypothetical protein [Dysgonomonas sp.]
MFYYAGYQAVFNEKKLPLFQSKNGLLSIPVKGTGKLEVDFKGTIIQKYSLYITLLSMVILILYIYYPNRCKNINKANFYKK